ncbi:MAG TPA: 1,4-dihydroxy-2-naphthoate octaprenyltransferase [Succinivibrionaceae bacterium]|nr:1,4-dihydroxy-2-naphthoate octaprenyltransferase [Succinivibrio sp.]HAR80430.1 1,4-dihydroxy-2-naphthoate octaprenyltransferase [Succinivibrionaceae bacterium]
MLRDWINETRPKTLLLGFTNCALGCALGFYYGTVSFYTATTAVAIIITGVLLQILCNFANDYGDACKNADTENRLGPIRAVMSGAISLAQLRKGMACVTMLSAFVGFIAVALAVGNNLQVLSWFIFLGVISILASLFYTLGMAYGYKGFGDLAVFIFFGVVAVIGSQILITSASDSGLDVFPDTIFISFSVGAESVMLLHVSSVRDIEEDRAHGKMTIASRLGYNMSAVYMIALFAVTFFASTAACFYSHKPWEIFILLVALLPLGASTIRSVIHISDGQKLARERKYIALGTTIHNISWIIVLILDYWIINS